MKYLIESIVIKDYDDANSIIEESLHYIIERKMIEKKKMIMAEKNAWNGMPSSRQEKLYRDVLEMDVSALPADYSDIEDRRKERGVNSSIKTNLGGEQKVASGKGNLQGKQTVNTSEKGDLKEEESGEESSMARSELNAITKDAKSIMSKVKGNKELEAWTQSKITKAADYLNSVADYMSEEDKKIDMTNKTCTKCHKGKYHETSQHDDMYGVLHCTKCGTQVKRWKVVKEDLDEEQLDEARIKLVKARIRGGKIERRKRVSNIPGMTLRGGQLKRMSAAERRRRKLGQRKGKLKRKAKMARTLMKRQRSLRRRKSLGI